jgi:hypothetical protein
MVNEIFKIVKVVIQTIDGVNGTLCKLIPRLYVVKSFLSHDDQLILFYGPNGWGIRCGGAALVLTSSNTVFYTADT